MTTKNQTAIELFVARSHVWRYTSRLGSWSALVLLGWGCRSPESAPLASEFGVATEASTSAERSASPPTSAAAAEAPEARTEALLESSPLVQLRVDEGGVLRGSLGGSPSVAVDLVLATKAEPVAHRALVAYSAIAEQLAPGLAQETVLREFSLAHLAEAAQGEAPRRFLRRDARVLADGRVRAAVMRAPAGPAVRVDVADLTQGGRAWSWEAQLVAREPVAGQDAALLSSYQELLAVDYVAGNLTRRWAELDEAQGRLSVRGASDVFSRGSVVGAVSDGLVRLSRHLTYSRALADRLGQFSRERLESRLRGGREELATPKQIDEIVSRVGSVQKLLQTRVSQRGRDRAFALP